MSPSFGDPASLSDSDILTCDTSSPTMYALISESPLRLYCAQFSVVMKIEEQGDARNRRLRFILNRRRAPAICDLGRWAEK